MQHACNKNNEGPVTEMAIVNTFTKLIFGDGSYTERELSIIRALRTVDVAVLHDNHQEMGHYLRNLGVREMIQLVSRLRQNMMESEDSASENRGRAVLSTSTHRPDLYRGDH